ncbi:MAG: MFS transporter [Pseudomonadota bacterium]
MLPGERRAALSLALVYMFRMVGLFIVLPVLALHAENLPGATPLLLGLAVGVYGLTQALLQIPFGALSDHIGRKPVIVAGLLIFAAGSAVAATADSVYGVVAGRALQGAGAVAAAIMALAADLSRDDQRTKVMAIIGASIGLAFLLSLMLGPLLSAWVGVPGLFWLSLALALGGALVVIFLVPAPQRMAAASGFALHDLGRVLSDRGLLSLNLSIFCLHGSLMALFVAVPFFLRDRIGIEVDSHARVYLPVMAAALLLAVPVIMRSGRSGAQTKALRLGLLSIAAGTAAMAVFNQAPVWLGALVVYFVGFNILEASLPSLVSRLVPGSHKGAALGAYSTSQFLGTFLGGALGGWALGALGVSGVLWGVAAVVLPWALLVWRAPLDPPWQSLALALEGDADGRAVADRLKTLEGIEEVNWVPAESLIYVRFVPSAVGAAEIHAQAQANN